MYLMGEKRLGRAPDEYLILKLAWEKGWKPDDIRAMAVDDRFWLMSWQKIHEEAHKEMARRKAESSNPASS